MKVCFGVFLKTNKDPAHGNALLVHFLHLLVPHPSKQNVFPSPLATFCKKPLPDFFEPLLPMLLTALQIFKSLATHSLPTHSLPRPFELVRMGEPGNILPAWAHAADEV